MPCLSLTDLQRVDPRPRTGWIRCASLATRALFGLRGVHIEAEGTPPPAGTPVIYATNHVHHLDFLPVRYYLRRHHRQSLITWIKPRAYQSRIQAAFFARTGNVPVASRGYLIAADAQALWGRAPGDDEYRELRAHVDEARPLPASPDIDALLTTPRPILGSRLPPGPWTYRRAIHHAFAAFMTETLSRSRRVLEAGHALHIYPQGTVSPRLGRLRTGAVQAAIALGVPIVPVGIGGMGRGLAPGTIHLRFGAPLTLPRLESFRAFDRTSEEHHRAHLIEQTDLLRERLSELVDDEQRSAGNEATPSTVARFL